MSIRLFAFDLEGTILSYTPLAEIGETPTEHSKGLWVRLAHALGAGALKADAELARAWDRGEIPSYMDWCNASLMSMREFGLSQALFDRVVQSYAISPGVSSVVEFCRARGIITAILSGGFLQQAQFAQTALGVLHVYAAADLVWGTDGQLESWSLSPSDFRGKVGYLRLLLEEYAIRPSECAFVGDGANDVHIATFVGKSFAYRASPRLAAVTTHSIADFNEILNHV
jgi:phosphoserine phosphatase